MSFSLAVMVEIVLGFRFAPASRATDVCRDAEPLPIRFGMRDASDAGAKRNALEMDVEIIMNETIVNTRAIRDDNDNTGTILIQQPFALHLVNLLKKEVLLNKCTVICIITRDYQPMMSTILIVRIIATPSPMCEVDDAAKWYLR